MPSTDSIEHLAKCRCGAITVTIDGKEYSMKPATFRKTFHHMGRIPRAEVTYGSCNHCVNHWGTDLCACGSGKAPNKCGEGLRVCGKPMQVIGKYSSASDSNPWRR
jgi:hypothetical protein